MRSPVATLTVADTPERLAALLVGRGATCATPAACVTLVTAESDEPAVEVELAEEE